MWRRDKPALAVASTDVGSDGWDRVITLAAVAAGALFFGIALYFTLRGGRSFEFDTKEYHIANLAKWLQTGSLWSLPYAAPGSITATHPGNGELFGLWLGLPTHGDELVYAMPLAFAALAVLAGAVAARELNGGKTNAAALGAIGVVTVLTSPVYFFTQVHSLMTDISSAACLLTALALLLVARRDPSRAMVVLAGVAIGVGLGSKYTAFIPTLALAGGAVLLLRRKRDWWWLVPGVVAFAGPWFLRNAIATGNPLFPQGLGPLAGGETPINLLDTPMVRHLLDRDTDAIRTWLRLGRVQIGLALVLIAAGPVLALRRRVADRTATLVTLGIAAVGFVAYLATPFSGGGPTGLAFMIVSCFRYALFVALLGVTLTAALAHRMVLGAFGIVLLWNLRNISGKYGPGRPDILLSHKLLAVAVVAALIVAGVVALAANGRFTRPSGRLTRAVAAAAVVVAIVGAAGVIHRIGNRRPPTALEATLLKFGNKTPAVVVGVVDFRAALGPRLDRPLVGIARGGAADELPFADENQVRRRVLGEAVPLPPARLVSRFSEAVDAKGTRLLVVSPTSPLGFPDGWVPSATWCFVGGNAEGAVYARRDVLPASLPCVPATASPSPASSGGRSQGVPGG